MRLSLAFSSAALIASVLATDASSYVNDLHLSSTPHEVQDSTESSFSTQNTVFKREVEGSSSIMDKAASELSRTVKNMRSYIGDSRYDFDGFYGEQRQVRQNIREIRGMIQEEATRPSLDSQFDLAWEMYLVMREALTEMEEWQGIDLKGTDLISQLYEIKVLVFKFLDDAGVPNRDMEGYKENVQALFDKWFNLGKAYLALPDKDFVRDHFALRFINSRKLLERLR